MQKYDLPSALANASWGMNLGQLLQSDAVKAWKDLQRLFSGKDATKVTVVTAGKKLD